MNRSKQQALLLLTFAWLCFMGARAGSVVVDATRTFQVGQNLKDLQDPPLVLSAQITDSTIVDLTDVRVGLHLVGNPSGQGFASEIFVSLNKDLAVTSILLNQVGLRTGNPVGFGYDGWNVTFSDSASEGDVHLNDFGSGIMTGEIQPDGRLKPEDSARPATLAILKGQTANGTWRLNVADLEFGGSMRLESWSLTLTGRNNRAPYFVGLTDVTIPESAAYTLPLVARDADIPAQPLTVELVEGPEGSTVVNGAFRWTPPETAGGTTQSVRVRVSDGVDSTTASFQVVVTEANTPPAFTGLTDFILDDLSPFSRTLVATDSDLPAQTLTYRLVGGPDGAELVDNVFQWTPIEEQRPSTNIVLVAVSDGLVSVTNQFTLFLPNYNTAPVMEAVPNKTVNEGVSLGFNLSAQDADYPPNVLTYSLVSGPPGMTVSAAGRVRWVPTEEQGPGVYEATVQVVDDGFPALSASQTFTVTVLERNLEPELAAIPNMTIEEVQPLVLALTATDADLPVQNLEFNLISGPEGMTVSAAGLLEWTPTESQGPGTYVVRVRVTDSYQLTAEQEFNLEVLEVPAAPVLPDLGTLTIPEMVAWTQPLGGSDSDLPTQQLTYTLVSGPEGLTLTAEGQLKWTPTEAQGPGTYTAKVQLTDDSGLSTEREYSIQVQEANRGPVLSSISAQSLEEGQTLTLVLQAVDRDLPANVLSYKLVSGPQGMTVDSQSGVLTWKTTESDGPSTQTVVVEVSDDAQTPLSSRVSFQVTVSENNQAPVLVTVTTQSVVEGVNLVVDLVASDADLPANTLRYRLIQGPTGLKLNSITGRVEWTPTTTQGPATYDVTVEAYDNGDPVLSVSQTFQVVVIDSNRAPVASNQELQGTEEVNLPITLQASDADGDTVTYTVVTPPQLGVLTGKAPNLTYIPKANANGRDQFTFVAKDRTLESEPATVVIQLAPINDAPVASGQQVSVVEDSPTPIVLTASDVDGDSLTYTIVAAPSLGTLSGAAPNLIYTPKRDATGADQFTYRVNDGKVDSGFATVYITIAPVNDAPVAQAQEVAATEDTAVSITLRGNDTEGDALTYKVVSGPKLGVLSGIAPNLVYTPNANANGTDQFTFRVKDGVLESGEATVNITIAAVNDAPLAGGLAVQTTEDTAVSLVLAASDVDGDVLNYTVVSGPKLGVLSGTAPNLVYTPNANANGTDQFTFKVKDGILESTEATVRITIAPVNDAPVAQAQEVAATEDTAVSITLRGNDTEGDALTYKVVSGPKLGVLSGIAPNLVYTPNANANGTDQFTFRVKDGVLESGEATVNITIAAVNDAPLAGGLAVQTTEDTAVSLVLAASDVDGDVLNYTVVSGPKLGVLSGTAPNLVYTPNANANGTDQFTFKVKDGILESTEATVRITIAPVNDAPVANGLAIQTTEDTAVPVVLKASDVDGDALTYTVVSGPKSGVLSGTAPQLIYTPNPNINGADQFTFRVKDGALESSLATVNITIAPINDAPVVAPILNQVLASGAALSLPLDATDVDVPSQTLTFSLKSGPSGMTLNSGNTLVWLPKGSQRPSTNRVVVGVTDGTASVETSFEIVAKAAEQVTLFSGVAIDGYIAGARVWFDANLNGIQDPEEPTTTTDRTGGFNLDFDSSRFDRNSNGKLESSEGRLVVEGGVDLSSGQPRVGQLVAPPGASVVTPLTTMVDLVSRQAGGLSAAAAEDQVRKALGLPVGISLTQYNPIDAAVKGDPSAAAVQVVSAAVADTIALMASVIDQAAPGVNAAQASALVSQALAEKLATSAQVDLKSSSLLSQTITAAASAASTVLSTQVTEAVSQVVAEQNATKQALVEKAANPLEALQAISQVQAVVHGAMVSSLGELGSGKTSADEVKLLYTGTALVESIAAAPVGDVTGTNVQPGLFEFSSATAVGVEDGRAVQPLSVLRKGGAYGKVQLTVRLSGDSMLLRTNVIMLEFEDGMTQQALDFKGILKDDASPQADRTITATLSLGGTPPAGTGLGGVTQSSIRVLDNDSAGSIGFVTAKYTGLEGDPVLVELERVNGTAGLIVAEIRLSGGTASLGSDYRSVQVPVTFASGQSRALIDVGWLDDGVYEFMESVNLSLTLSSGSAPGASLISGRSVAILEVNEKPSVNRSPVLAGVDDVRTPWGTAVVLLLQGTDPDVPKDHLTYSMISGPEALKIDAETGLLEWTPEPTDAGKDFDITVRVTDSGFPPLKAEQVFRITVTAKPVANRPPVFSAIPDQLLKPGVNWRLTPVATDPDLPANSLTYRLVSGPAGLRMDSLTGVLEWKPSEADAGNSYEVLIEVSDNGKPPQSSRQAFKLRVAEVEIAPLLEIQVLEASSNLELKVIGTRRSTLRILSSYDLKTWTPYGEVLMTSSAMTISVPVEGASQFFRLQEAP